MMDESIIVSACHTTLPGLFRWAQLFIAKEQKAAELADFLDFKVLNVIFEIIDGRIQEEDVTTTDDSIKARVRNWHRLVGNMKNYYLEALQEVITMKPPNIVLISRLPKSAEAKHEVERILECLVCAAVRCERRDHFIHEIMHRLGAEVQAGIMETITSFTVDEEKVVSLNKLNSSPSEWLRVFRLATDGLESVYLKEIYSLLDEIACLQSKVTSLQAQARMASRLNRAKSLCRIECCPPVTSLGDPTRGELTTTSTPRLDFLLNPDKDGEVLVVRDPSPADADQPGQVAGSDTAMDDSLAETMVAESGAEVAAGLPAELAAVYGPDNQRVSIELAEVRAKLRRTRAELEEQADQLIEVHEQLRETRRELGQVKEERARLADAAHNARHWQDEVDALREVADRAQLLERENASLKERLHKADYYKMRCQQLTEDLAVLSEERKRADATQVDDEGNRLGGLGMQELKKAHQRLLELEQLRNSDLDDLHKLREELGKLRLEHKIIPRPTSITTATTPEFETRPGEGINLVPSPCATNKPLSDQLFESVASRLHQLEAENHRLMKQLCSRGDLQALQQNGSCTENLGEEMQSLNSENHSTGVCSQCAILKTKLMAAAERVVKAEEDRNEISKCLANLRRQISASTPSDLPSPPPEDCTPIVDTDLLNRPATSSCGHDGDDEGEEDEVAVHLKDGESVNNLLEEDCEVDSGNKTGDSTEETVGQKMDSSRLRRRSRLKDRRYRSRAWLESEIVQLEAEISAMEETNGTLKIRLIEAQNNAHKIETELSELKNKTLNNTELQCQLSKLNDSLRTSEQEVWRLRRDLHRLESEADEGKNAKLQVTRLEHELSTSKSAHQLMVKETENRLKEVEKEQAGATQQLTVEKQTVITLREELVNEKINRQHQVNLLQRLKSRLEQFGFSADQINRMADIDENGDTLATIRQAVMARMASEINSELTGAQSRLQELRAKSTLANRQLAATNQGSSGPTAVTAPPVQLLTELKCRLAELEHENARVEMAHQKEVLAGEETKTCVKHLERRLSVFQGQLTSGQAHLADLIATNARLQVENTTMRSQVDSLTANNASISKRCSDLEGEANRMTAMVRSAHAAEAQVATDYCHLQRLHEQLSHDYDVLNQSLKETKETERQLKQEVMNTRSQLEQLQLAAEEVQNLKLALEQERGTLKGEARHLVWTVEECARLRAQIDTLKADREEWQAEKMAVLERARETRRQLENEENRTRRLHSELEARRTGDQRLQLEAVELRSKVQMYTDANAKLEKENRLLMVQLQSLLTQNQELLMSTMETCTNRVQEEGALRERLLSLQRQKQYFEDRVMEQYRAADHSNRSQKRLSLMQRARAVLSKRKDNTISRGGRSASSMASNKEGRDRTLFTSAESNDSDLSSLNLSNSGSKRNTISPNHLIPGSVSIFDRDPDECDASDIRAFLTQLNNSPNMNKNAEVSHRRCGSLSVQPNRQRHQSSSLRLSSSSLMPASADKGGYRQVAADSPNAEVIRLSRHPSGADDRVTESRLSTSRSAYSFHSMITYNRDSTGGNEEQQRQILLNHTEQNRGVKPTPRSNVNCCPMASEIVDSRRSARYHHQRSASQHHSRIADIATAPGSVIDAVSPVGAGAWRTTYTERLPATDRCEKRLCEVLTVKSTLENPDRTTLNAISSGNATSKMTRSPSARSFLSSPRLAEINHTDSVFQGRRSSNSMATTLPTPTRSQTCRDNWLAATSDMDLGNGANSPDSTVSNSPQYQKEMATTEQDKSRVSLEVVGKPRVLLEYGAL